MRPYTMPKAWTLAVVIVAIVLLPCLSLLYSSEFCAGGDGYGFPFPMLHPHGSIRITPEYGVDPMGVLKNIGAWSLASVIVGAVAAGILSQKEGAT